MVAAICDEFKWTYDQYLDQPVWMIPAINRKRQIDRDKQEHESRTS